MTRYGLLYGICGMLLCITACNNELESGIPASKVNLSLDLSMEDFKLTSPLASMSYIRPRISGEATGYGGILVVSGFNDQLFAYDLSCPNEKKPTVRIVPSDNGTATCPTCNTLYDTANGSGNSIKGAQKLILQRYRCLRTGSKIRVVN